VKGTINRARFLLHFYRLKNEGPSGEDKEKSRKTTHKMCLPLEGELKREDTKHPQKVPFNPKFTLLTKDD